MSYKISGAAIKAYATSGEKNKTEKLTWYIPKDIPEIQAILKAQIMLEATEQEIKKLKAQEEMFKSSFFTLTKK